MGVVSPSKSAEIVLKANLGANRILINLKLRILSLFSG